MPDKLRDGWRVDAYQSLTNVLATLTQAEGCTPIVLAAAGKTLEWWGRAFAEAAVDADFLSRCDPGDVGRAIDFRRELAMAH
jgi:hypothetical protein